MTLWMFCSWCWAGTCDAPYLGLTRNPILTYPITYQPVLKGNVKVEFFAQLACPAYATYNWDALKGPYYISVLQGTAVYARITVSAADNSLPTASTTYYFKPPAAPLQIRPNAPTGFKIL